MRIVRFSFVFVVLFLISVESARAAESGNAYREHIEAWRQQHEAALKGDGGWLTVTGLYWLHAGDNLLGAGPENDIVLPAGAPARLGTVHVADGALLFTAAAGSAVTIGGKAQSSATLQPDGPPQPIVSGPLTLILLKRGSRLALRLKDRNSALRQRFTHLDWYPVSEDWRITGHFTAFPTPRKLVFDTIIGEQETANSPGYVEFERNGEHYKLQAASAGQGLFFVIRDQTSGKTTYAASRFLTADAPSADGTVVLDFNKATNPPCAFTNFATCPLPPAQNRLNLAIEAGERKYEGSAH